VVDIPEPEEVLDDEIEEGHDESLEEEEDSEDNLEEDEEGNEHEEEIPHSSTPFSWMKTQLMKVHPAFIIAAIIAVIWIEFFMISMQSYQDHPEMWIGLAIYVVITLVSIVILKYLFSIRYRTVLSVMTANNLLIIIPIGTIISLATGYTFIQLFSPGWQFTHDFVYIMIVSQLAVTAIMLFGIWWRTREKAAEDETEEDELAYEDEKASEETPASTSDIGSSSRVGLTNGFINGNVMHGADINDTRKPNGFSNGFGMINGLTNGLKISPGMTNGLKPANGGFSNGVRKTNGSRSLSAARSRSLRKKAKRIATPVIAVALIFLMLVLPPFLNTIFGSYVDEEPTRDWRNVTLYSDESETLDSNIDILGYKAVADDDYLWTYVNVGGSAMGDIQPNTNTALVLIDSDRDRLSGYSIGGIGADYMVRAYGHDSKIRETSFYEFSRVRGNTDWNGWIRYGTSNAYVSDSTIQTRTSLSQIENAKEPIVLFALMNSGGIQDYSDTPIDLGESAGALIVEQVRVAGDIIENGVVDIMTLELTANGGPVTIDSIDITPNQGIILPHSYPLMIASGESRSLTVKLDTGGLAPGTFVEVGLDADDVESDAGTISLSGPGLKAYVASPPDGISIDGAFAEWNAVKDEPIQDSTGETVNQNVDLSEYLTTNENTDVYFYVKVEGDMMAGAMVPALSRKYIPPKIAGPGSSNGDGVNVQTGSQDNSPLPELTGEDGIHLFVDTDKNKETGYHPEHPFEFPVGADYMVEIKGSEGLIRSSSLFEYRGLDNPWDWEFVKNVRSECDKDRLESGLTFADMELSAPVFDVYIHVTDWRGDEDYSDSVLSQGLSGLESIKADDPPEPKKNGGFGDGDIDTIDGASCAGGFGCHTTYDNTQVPISISFNPAGPYNPGQTGIQITVTINMDAAAAGSIAGVTVRVGPTGGNARLGIENDGWIITNDPNSGTNNYIEQSGLVGAGATNLVWTVTAPSAGGTYYIEATVFYDNDGSGREHNRTSEQTITVIPEFPHLLFPILAMIVVFGVLRKGRKKKTV
jgi:hypothetical protein